MISEPLCLVICVSWFFFSFFSPHTVYSLQHTVFNLSNLPINLEHVTFFPPLYHLPSPSPLICFFVSLHSLHVRVITSLIPTYGAHWSLTAMAMERSRWMSWRRAWRPSLGRSWRKESWRRSSPTLTSTKTATSTLMVSGWGHEGRNTLERSGLQARCNRALQQLIKKRNTETDGWVVKASAVIPIQRYPRGFCSCQRGAYTDLDCQFPIKLKEMKCNFTKHIKIFVQRRKRRDK